MPQHRNSHFFCQITYFVMNAHAKRVRNEIPLSFSFRVSVRRRRRGFSTLCLVNESNSLSRCGIKTFLNGHTAAIRDVNIYLKTITKQIFLCFLIDKISDVLRNP